LKTKSLLSNEDEKNLNFVKKPHFLHHNQIIYHFLNKEERRIKVMLLTFRTSTQKRHQFSQNGNRLK
jgi:hypothetical protein